MAFLGNVFDPSAEPSQDFPPIPSGEYPAIIVDSDMKPTKNNAGQYLELAYKIIEGPFANRQVWARFNLDNPSSKAVEIAQQHLAAVVAACGMSNAEVKDSGQLHNIPHVIRVEFVPADGARRQKDTNEVKAWKRIEAGQPLAGAAAQPAQQVAAQQAPPFARPSVPVAPPGAPAWAQRPAA